VIGQRMAAPGASDFFLLQQNGKRLAGNLPAMPPRSGIVTLPPGRIMPCAGGGRHDGAGALCLFRQRSESRQPGPGAYPADSDLGVRRGAAAGDPGGSLVSRSFLSRTDAIAQACRAIMDGDLRTRIPVRGTQDELDRLSQTINAMLDRIAALMENVRQVTNDIAHDLRTPVTHLRHRLERARGQASPADYDKALEAAILASDDILALFAALLRIAQIEGGARRAAFAPVALADILYHLKDMLGPVADDARQALCLSIAQTATIRGDRELLMQLFSNLIENAIVHTPAGTSIVLGLRVDSGFAIVEISDNGPGVPQEEQEKLFQRFYRREASRTRPGYGLGLALVRAIAQLHGAETQIARGAGNGFSVSVSFALQ
jgi:signal transduction histidine kinase